MDNLRSVALHEYAHLHVAQHFGVWGWINIRRGEANAFAGEFTAEPIDDAHARRIIGLAGSCAELLDRDPGTRFGLDDLRLSRSDALMAGAFDATHIAECVAILRAA